LAVGIVALGAVLAVREVGLLATWNHTPSLPEGLYVRAIATEPAVGQIVAFPAPAAARDYARQRGGRGDATLFLKPLAAGPGDHVCVTDHLTINGWQIASVFEAAADGVPLPRWRECRVLEAGEWFAYAPRIPNSLDSRYYGPVREADMGGVFRLVWEWKD
jgi:conjugative transfer signal peptidase TraF